MQSHLLKEACRYLSSDVNFSKTKEAYARQLRSQIEPNDNVDRFSILISIPCGSLCRLGWIDRGCVAKILLQAIMMFAVTHSSIRGYGLVV